MCYYFGDMIRFWDRDIKFWDILLAKKSYETYKNILTYDISCKTVQRVQNHCLLGSIKWMYFLIFMIKSDIYYVMILIKLVANKNKNEHYYSIYLEKNWYKEKSST